MQVNARLNLNQSGFSLIEVIVSVAISVVVSLGVAYMIASTRKVQNDTEMVSQADRVHMINLQRMRNTARLAEAAGVAGTNANPAVIACFEGHGTGCQQYSAPYEVSADPETSDRKQFRAEPTPPPQGTHPGGQ